MSDIKVKVGQDNLKVRVGQQNAIKVVSGVSGLLPNVENSFNVIGGIASVSQLYVSGISTFAGTSNFVGITNFNNNLYIDSSSALYLRRYNEGGVAYFDTFGKMVSTRSPSYAIDYTNYIFTTDNSGQPTWSSTIDGGEY
jgi:hypothetical protein